MIIIVLKYAHSINELTLWIRQWNRIKNLAHDFHASFTYPSSIAVQLRLKNYRYLPHTINIIIDIDMRQRVIICAQRGGIVSLRVEIKVRKLLDLKTRSVLCILSKEKTLSKRIYAVTGGEIFFFFVHIHY